MRVAVGDAVYLTGVSKGRPAEIAQIEGFESQEENGDIFMDVTWYWRGEALEGVDESIDWHERELFLQTEPEAEEQTVCALELTKCHVRRAEMPLNGELSPHCFFTCRTWDVKAKVVSELPDKEAPAPMETDAPAQAPPPPPATAPAAPATAKAAPARRRNAARGAREYQPPRG